MTENNCFKRSLRTFSLVMPVVCLCISAGLARAADAPAAPVPAAEKGTGARLKSSRELADEAQSGVTFISQAALRQRIATNPRLVLLDVRTKEEFDGGHLKGAAWVERGIVEFMLVRQLPDPDAEIVVY